MPLLTEMIAARPVIAVLRASSAQWLRPAVDVLHEYGFDNVEITLTTPGAVDVIREITASHPEVLVGAGTVRSAEQAREAVAAGARYLVSQVTDADVLATAREIGVPYVPGCLTPNEIVAAWKLGVSAVKVSPIGPVGGVDYLRELRGPLPDVPLMPTGGVRLEEVVDYLAAGAVAVGVSRHLFGDALESGDFDDFRRRTSDLAARLTDAGHLLQIASR